jgi:hypothetical protein
MASKILGKKAADNRRREEMEKLLERIRSRESMLKGVSAQKKAAGKKEHKHAAPKHAEKKRPVKKEHRVRHLAVIKKMKSKVKNPSIKRSPPAEKKRDMVKHPSVAGKKDAKKDERKRPRGGRIKKIIKKISGKVAEPVRVVREAHGADEHRGEYLETDIDKLYRIISKNGMVRVADASKTLKVQKSKIEEWGRILEEHELILLHYPPFGEPVLILRKFQLSPKIRSKKKGRKAMLLNVAIIAAFVLFILFYTGRLRAPVLPPGWNSPPMIYLFLLPIIILAVVLAALALRKARKGRRKK